MLASPGPRCTSTIMFPSGVVPEGLGSRPSMAGSGMCKARFAGILCGISDPLYLAVTCSVFACGVQDYGLFLGDHFRTVSVCNTPWFDSGYMFGVGLRTLFWFSLKKTAWIFRSGSPTLVVDISCGGAEVDSHGPLTTEIPQFTFDMVIDVTVCRSRRFALSWCRCRFPRSRLFVGPQRFSICWTWWLLPLLYRLQVPGHPHPCRGAETVSHGLADHGDSAVARGQGVRRPCLHVVSVPQVPSW